MRDNAAPLPPTGLAQDRPSREGIALLASLTLFWGVNWPAMKLAVNDIDPWTFRTLCLVAGGAGLLLIARLSGSRRIAIPRADLMPLLLASLLNVTGWHLGTAFGLTFMGAGRASIIAFTMPVWASLFGVVLLGERLTRARVAGLALGVAGLGFLLVPEVGKIGASPGARCSCWPPRRAGPPAPWWSRRGAGAWAQRRCPAGRSCWAESRC
ncbi:MAG TPA: DMT family transporter [Azospirillum sp.]|nr:DMT family transporter [Azospirillum sp.]